MTYMEKSAGPECPMEGLRLLGDFQLESNWKGSLKYVLDEDEFLSPYGIRSLSKYHEKHPFSFHVNGSEMRVPVCARRV